MSETNGGAPERVWVDMVNGGPVAWRGNVSADTDLVEYVRADLSEAAPVEQQDAMVAALKASEDAVLAWLDWMALPGDTTALGHHNAMMSLKDALATLLRFRELTP